MCEGSSPRDALLSLTKPTVFYGMINDWDVLKWKLDDWTSLYGDRPLPFRSGLKCCSPEPLWEGRCSREIMTMKQFSDFVCDSTVSNSQGANNTKKWLYFDYKYICELAQSEKDALKSITWSKFGFPEVDAQDSTLWIGSAGAHTPCHFDTYGCNLVAQVLGRKQWILFPQNELKNMRPTRIPYEESSIYSLWNFNSPLPKKFYENCKQVYIINLQPGDVLFVPRHWWHYVESLETSVSINTWLPNKLDDISRMDEALVKLFVSQISSNLSVNAREDILNPNEGTTDTLDCCLNLIKACNDNLEKSQGENKLDDEPPLLKKTKFEESTCGNRLLETKSTSVPLSTMQELEVLMDGKCNCNSLDVHHTFIKERFSNLNNSSTHNGHLNFLTKVMNAFCDPDVIMKVREKLTEGYVKEGGL